MSSDPLDRLTPGPSHILRFPKIPHKPCLLQVLAGVTCCPQACKGDVAVGMGAGLIRDTEFQAEIAANEEECVERLVVAPGPGDAGQDSPREDARAEQPPGLIACVPDTFGKRADLLAEAWKRIAADPGSYAQKAYGTEEAGGTSLLIIGPSEVMAAFDPRIPQESLPKKTWVVLSQIPTAVGVAGAVLLGVNWIIRRRIALAAANGNTGGNGNGHDGPGNPQLPASGERKGDAS